MIVAFRMKEGRTYIRNGAVQPRRLGEVSGAVPEMLPRLSSVATAIRLLKCFSDDEYELGVGALAVRLGVAKSTAHRLATTLVQGGLLEQVPATAKYRPAVLLFELGSLVRRKMDVYREAKDFLRDLRERTGETINLAVLTEGNVVYLNSLESRRAIKVVSILGMRLPAHCSAEGKVLMAFGPRAVAERILRGEMVRRTAHTITDPAALRAELELVRRQGYAVDNEESEVGARAVAAPVLGGEGVAVAAIGIAAPAQRLARKTLVSYLPQLQSAAAAVAQHRDSYSMPLAPGSAAMEG
jgi:DNA-binding IclR family transcriptional regulator